MTSMMPDPQMPVTPLASDCLGEARLVRPEIAADDPEARLERLAVDAHALDGAWRGALAGADLGALEGGAGGARAASSRRASPSTISALVPTSTRA